MVMHTSSEGMFGHEFAVRHRKRLAPAQWWKKYGYDAPHLQRLAIKILSLTCSASGCERNWSVFEQVKYNQKLCERYSIRDKIDPISLKDIDECNVWLVGELDDPEVVGTSQDLVFDGDTHDWEIAYDASGIGESTTFTRSKKRKDTSTSSSYVRASKKDTRTAATLGKGKEKLQHVVEEMTLVDESDEEELEQEFEQEEEEEGYEDDEDDYMALDDEDGDEE
ncbi:E3 ubiquitin-protein ligase HUWE1-like [Salvia splendens]|uniref:E3 ubiquitin-protein ligase HUWE1-like n=1 Tax=Salvia splendens TaxID=180675 RepID=UPI001C270C87|nr:E3 ubiquitin-protein ligase HUWE1-like [Salvia splendens]